MLHIKRSTLLQEKIRGLRKAIVHCPDDEFFNLQAVEAQVITLDENCFLWLSVEKPPACADSNSTSFDVVLNYHKENVPFDLDLLGEAKLITEKEALQGCKRSILNEFHRGKLILKVHIIDVDYWEEKEPVLKRVAKKVRHIFSNNIENNSEEVYHEHQVSA